jgi:cation transporter-like permease
MKNSWLAYVIAAVISALAGVAIAGVPNSVGIEPTIVVPTSTTTTSSNSEVVED